jgi:DNA processing protein
MSLLRALTALSHTATQFFFQWLPPPCASALAASDLAAAFDREPASDLAAWPREDWADLVACLRERPELRPQAPWAAKVAADPRRGEILIDLLMRHLRLTAAAGATYLTYHDSAYPETLRAMADPPLALTLEGDLTLLERRRIGVVGSRKASALAMRESFALGRLLAETGFSVVSGGALGCDIAAHQGVLAARLLPPPAVCVFAGGLSALYPRRNEWVFRQLRGQGGLLASERFWWAYCRPIDFPARNRIIAGLSEMVVVMQATQRSGALITARLALDQGRDVAVLEHPADDVRALGSTALLTDGATGFAPERAAAELLPLLNL